MNQRYKIFIDTEFNQNADPVELISIGLVTNTDREFYATISGSDDGCDAWLLNNVIEVWEQDDIVKSNTVYHKGINKYDLQKELQSFIGPNKFDAWGYYADYDWYLFTRLWGSFDKLPENFPHLCYDVKQFSEHRLIQRVTQFVPEFKPEHHALVDARWTKAAYEFVREYQGASLRGKR